VIPAHSHTHDVLARRYQKLLHLHSKLVAGTPTLPAEDLLVDLHCAGEDGGVGGVGGGGAGAAAGSGADPVDPRVIAAVTALFRPGGAPLSSGDANGVGRGGGADASAAAAAASAGGEASKTVCFLGEDFVMTSEQLAQVLTRLCGLRSNSGNSGNSGNSAPAWPRFLLHTMCDAVLAFPTTLMPLVSSLLGDMVRAKLWSDVHRCERMNE
jgi:hypothetical protein